MTILPFIAKLPEPECLEKMRKMLDDFGPKPCAN